MAQAKESKKDKPVYRVLLYVQTAEDASILQDILTGIGAEGVVCTDLGDLCWRTVQGADAVLLTEQSIVDGALPVLAEALESQPEWSDLPVLFVAAGGAESPLAVQAMQELRNVVILDRPVRIATLASVLGMVARVRDRQRQVRDLLQEVEAKTETLTDTIGRLESEAAGRALAEGELHKSSQMLEAFFQHTIAPLAFMNRDFNFVWLNEAYARADGKSPEYFAGKNHFALYPNAESQAIVEQVVRTRQPYHAYARPFRYPDDPKTLGQTAGFGLLSIRERVELLGGHMKIRSTPGRGSTFLIAVPDSRVSPRARLGAEQAISEVADRAAGRENGTCLRVLLADDHKVVREGLAILLNEQEDIEVVGQAANGWEAVDLAHKLQPDVVVMDASMPVMEGDEATRQIKRQLPQTRVVALSMHDEARVMDQMCKAGASAYLLKTAPSEELLAAIRGPKENGIQ